MKRLIWLLALPYVVRMSSESPRCEGYIADCKEKICMTVTCSEWSNARYWYSIQVDTETTYTFANEEFARDVAESLNEAHERRKRPPMWYVLPPDVIKRSSTTFHLYDDMLPAGGFYK